MMPRTFAVLVVVGWIPHRPRRYHRHLATASKLAALQAFVPEPKVRGVLDSPPSRV
jgi:hypothetical protein